MVNVRWAARRSLSERRRAVRALVAAAPPMLPGYDLAMGSLCRMRYYQALNAAGHTELAADAWPFDGPGLGDVPGVLFRDGDDALVATPAGLALVGVHHGWFRVEAAADTQDAAAGLCSTFRAWFPAAYLTQDADGRIPITFWTLGRYGPDPRLRKIEAATWDEIAGNYCGAVRAELDRLMQWKEGPETEGQLLLWHGEPGTGKSWGLRALASEWAPWAEFHYITDPDSFFVTDPSYMIQVLLSDSYQEIDAVDGRVYEQEKAGGKWRVLILEDTGELLSADAKTRSGQGLSRLLNVVDGMIGQGLRVLAIITTNEELETLHPAVVRPGRCASQIEFAALSAPEASVWLGETVEQGGTLAELYARRTASREAFAAGTEVELERIAPDATVALAEFWKDHPDMLESEKTETGIDPVGDPLGYWRVELAEPAHADIRAEVNTDGVFTLDLAKRWMQEEETEATTAAGLALEAVLAIASAPLLTGRRER